MKSRLRMYVVLLTLFGVTLACNFPTAGRDPSGRAPATPNFTMTALYGSGLLGSLTPEPGDGQSQTATPQSQEPIMLPTATSAPAQPQPATNTAAPGVTIPAPATQAPNPATVTPPPTQVMVRSGTAVRAPFLSTPPTLDGVWDEWTTPAYPATFVTYGSENWEGAEDLEGSYRVGWDNNYLYIAVKVIDDEYVQNATREELYLGDSIELLLDTNLQGDFNDNSLNQDDFQLGISPGRPDVNGTREAYLWYPNNISGPREIRIGSVRNQGVTRIEAAIPWTVFGVTPAADQRFGFVLSASDNDNPNANQQQTLVSSTRGRRLTDPTTWGELVLTR